MEKYILQILESNTRVIVPDFGAFIVKQRNPFTVIINEFLQYNDGVMVDAIAKNEGISREDAKQKVDDFVKQINDSLEKGGIFPLGNLGVIAKGGNGKITLEKADESKKSAKKEPEKVIEAGQQKKKVTSAKKKQEVKTVTSEKTKATNKKAETVIKEQIDKDPEVVEKQEENKGKEPEVPVTEKAAPQPASEEMKPPKTKEVQVQKPEPKQVPEPVRSARVSETEPAPKYKRSNIVIWVIIILVVNALLIGYFIYSDELTGLFVVKNQDTLTTEPVFEQDTTTLQEPLQAAVISEEKTGNIQPEEVTAENPDQEEASPAGTQYYIVAGVFRDEQNANKLVVELRKKGFNAQRFGKIGDLYAVSYEAFASKNDADRFLLKIQKESDPEAWIRTVK